MASRSTRTKIRFQAEKAIDDIDNSLEHLAKIDAIQGQRSEFINRTIPEVVTLLEAVKEMLAEWRRRL